MRGVDSHLGEHDGDVVGSLGVEQVGGGRPLLLLLLGRRRLLLLLLKSTTKSVSQVSEAPNRPRHSGPKRQNAKMPNGQANRPVVTTHNTRNGFAPWRRASPAARRPHRPSSHPQIPADKIQMFTMCTRFEVHSRNDWQDDTMRVSPDRQHPNG